LSDTIRFRTHLSAMTAANSRDVSTI